MVMRNRARSYMRYSRFPREHFLTVPGQARGTAPGKGSPDARSSSVGAIRPSWLTRTLAWASADPYARRSATRAVPLLSGARRPAVPHAAPPCRSPPLHGNQAKGWLPKKTIASWLARCAVSLDRETVIKLINKRTPEEARKIGLFHCTNSP